MLYINSAGCFLCNLTNPNTFHQKQEVLAHAKPYTDGLQM
jgi:hypothetical protein